MVADTIARAVRLRADIWTVEAPKRTRRFDEPYLANGVNASESNAPALNTV
jgi:hypothetical protein